MLATPLDGRLRQIAVLVASVDADAARHVLLNLPTEIAKKVRSMAAEIGPIPPEERQALMAELQRSQANRLPHANCSQSHSPAVAGSVTADSAAKFWSGFSDFKDTSTLLQPSNSSDQNPDVPAWTQLSEEALVRFIRHERPTVVAVIIHQLPAKQAASVLQRLPRSMGREVLNRLGSLQDIDPEAMQAIDEQLSHRLSDYRHQVENEMENSKKINALLAVAPPELKQQWASWIRPDVFTGDEANSRTEWAEGIRSENEANAASNSEPPATIPMFPRQDSRQSETHRSPSNNHATAVDRTRQLLDFERILTLKPEQLAALLTSLDSQTVLLSLAGATPKFIKQFNALLEPEDAKLLEERLSRIGPVGLRDMDEAQKRVVEAYWSMTAPRSFSRAA